MKSLLSLLKILFLTLNCFAAGELIPPLRDQTERKQFILKVQKQIPFAKFNTEDQLDRQINGVAALREKFPEYDQWMKEKPDPLSIDVYNVVEVRFHGISLNPTALLQLQNRLLAKFEAEIKKLDSISEPNEFRNALITQSLTEILQSLQAQDGSYRGILVGLAQLLPAEERAHFFKVANPWQQLKILEDLKINDSTLRLSRFRAETLGLNQNEITIEQVLSIARKRIESSEKIFESIAFLKLLTSFEADQFTSDTRLKGALGFLSRSLSDIDFDFGVKAKDPFLTEIGQWFVKNEKMTEAQYHKYIDAYLENHSKTKFLVENQPRQNKRLLAKVVEVNPYLGVHRGCIGGDCSTTSSPMFPYSPWEHIFYVLSSEGRFVGYVSATRVLSEGESCLYLKDITGTRLSANLAEAVLYAFAKVLPHYNSKRLLLAAPSFTNYQNHFHPLKTMLGHYNQIGDTAPIDFIDKQVREFIGSNSAIFSSSIYYDGPQSHRNGVSFKPKLDWETKIEITATDETLKVPPDKSGVEEVLGALKLMARNSSLTVLDFPEINSKTLRTLVQSLANKKSLKLTEYYSDVEAAFTKYDVQVNSNFRARHEELFYFGHLRALDALSSPDESLARETERFLQIVSRQHLNFEETMRFVARWSKSLNKSAKFQELIEIYISRLQPRDVFQLVGFAELGIQGILPRLQSAENQAKIEIAIQNLLQFGPTQFGISEKNAQSQPVQSLLKLFNFFKNRARQTEDVNQAKLNELLKPFGLSPAVISNEFLKSKIQLLTVNSLDAFKTKKTTSNTRHLDLLKSLIQRNLISRNDFLSILESAEKSLELLELVNKRIEFLASRHEHLDILELHLLYNLDFTLAESAFEQKTLQELNLAFLRDIALGRNRNRESENMLHTFKKFKIINEINFSNFLTGIEEFNGSAQQNLALIRKTAADLKLSLTDFISEPEFLKVISQRWFSRSDLFDSRDSDVLNFTTRLLGIQIDNNSLNFDDWKKLATRFEYLNQKLEFRQFLKKLQNSFETRNCEPCALGTILLILNQNIPNSLNLSESNIRILMQSDQPLSRVFGTHLAIKMKIPFALSENEAAKFSLIAESGLSSIPLNANKALRNLSLEILMKSPIQSEIVQRTLFKILKNEPMNSFAIKAGLAYLACGGEPFFALRDLNLRYNRTEMMNSENPQDRALYSEFMSRLRDPRLNLRPPMSCKAIFKR